MLYVLLIFLSAMAINGFYNITRGQWNTKPNGTKEWSGKIFSFYSRFLCEHDVLKEFYIDEEWLKIFFTVRIWLKPEDILSIEPNGVILRKFDHNERKQFESFLAHHDLHFISKGYGDGEIYQFYKEVNRYKIPSWVSAPIGECITCLASVGGTLCWLFWYFLIAKFNDFFPTIETETLISMPLISKVGLWVFFCISLAWANEILFFINNKLKN